MTTLGLAAARLNERKASCIHIRTIRRVTTIESTFQMCMVYQHQYVVNSFTKNFISLQNTVAVALFRMMMSTLPSATGAIAHAFARCQHILSKAQTSYVAYSRAASKSRRIYILVGKHAHRKTYKHSTTAFTMRPRAQATPHCRKNDLILWLAESLMLGSIVLFRLTQHKNTHNTSHALPA